MTRHIMALTCVEMVRVYGFRVRVRVVERIRGRRRANVRDGMLLWVLLSCVARRCIDLPSPGVLRTALKPRAKDTQR
jgi:hypothetical protein